MLYAECQSVTLQGGLAALHHACKTGQAEDAQKFLKAGASVNKKDRVGLKAWHVIVQTLLIFSTVVCLSSQCRFDGSSEDMDCSWFQVSKAWACWNLCMKCSITSLGGTPSSMWVNV